MPSLRINILNAIAFFGNKFSVYINVVSISGPIDDALSLPVCQFLSKLSYCMYLTHYPLISYTYAIFRTEIYFDEYLVVRLI